MIQIYFTCTKLKTLGVGEGTSFGSTQKFAYVYLTQLKVIHIKIVTGANFFVGTLKYMILTIMEVMYVTA